MPLHIGRGLILSRECNQHILSPADGACWHCCHSEIICKTVNAPTGNIVTMGVSYHFTNEWEQKYTFRLYYRQTC